MINSKKLMGDALPKGGKRVALNLGMSLALFAALVGAGWSLWGRTQTIPGTNLMVRWPAIGVFLGFIGLVVIGHFWRKLNQKLDRIESKLGDK